MTIAEFRAWLEGYEASFSGPPSAEQWEAVKVKLARVQAVVQQPIPSGATTVWTVPRNFVAEPHGAKLTAARALT